MARSRRKEVKRVELTPDEDKALFLILNKAIAAERAGDLAKALEHYTEYKEELLKIKRKKRREKKKKEKEKEELPEGVWDREMLIQWVTDEIKVAEPRKWVKQKFDFSEFPKLKIKKGLDLSKYPDVTQLPPNLKEIEKHAYLVGTKIERLPDGLVIGGHLTITDLPIKDLPDDLVVEGQVRYSKKAPETLKAKVEELISKGQVKRKSMWF